MHPLRLLLAGADRLRRALPSCRLDMRAGGRELRRVPRLARPPGRWAGSSCPPGGSASSSRPREDCFLALATGLADSPCLLGLRPSRESSRPSVSSTAATPPRAPAPPRRTWSRSKADTSGGRGAPRWPGCRGTSSPTSRSRSPRDPAPTSSPAIGQGGRRQGPHRRRHRRRLPLRRRSASASSARASRPACPSRRRPGCIIRSAPSTGSPMSPTAPAARCSGF